MHMKTNQFNLVCYVTTNVRLESDVEQRHSGNYESLYTDFFHGDIHGFMKEGVLLNAPLPRRCD